MLENIVIWGASGHALVVADIIALSGRYRIAGLLDDVNLDRHGQQFGGYPILGGREQLECLKGRGVGTIALGFGHCAGRLRIAGLVKSHGFSLATLVHPRATVASSATIGEGTVIAAGAVVNPLAVVKEHVIINTSASVDHECVIGEGAHICPGVHLAGAVVIGRAAWVGIGTAVSNNLTIGAGALVGAGSVVVKDIPEGVLAFGVPASVIRKLDSP